MIRIKSVNSVGHIDETVQRKTASQRLEQKLADDSNLLEDRLDHLERKMVSSNAMALRSK